MQNSLGRTLELHHVNAGALPGQRWHAFRDYAYDGSANLTASPTPSQKDHHSPTALPGQMTSLYYPSFPRPPPPDQRLRQPGAREDTRTMRAARATTITLRAPHRGNGPRRNGPHQLHRRRRATPCSPAPPRANGPTNTYDGQSRLIRKQLPEGNATEYAYDDAPCAGADKRCTHNVKTSPAWPSPAAALATLNQRFTYESAFNKVEPRQRRGQGHQLQLHRPGPAADHHRPGRPRRRAPQTSYTYSAFTAERLPELLPAQLADGQDQRRQQRGDRHRLQREPTSTCPRAASSTAAPAS